MRRTSTIVRRFFAVLAISTGFVACSDPFPGIVYTFKTGDICSCGGPADNLVYATDEYGNILDVKVYQSNQTVQLVSLNSSIPARINLTYVRYSKDGSFTTINTNLGVSTKRTLDPDATYVVLAEPKEWLQATVNNFEGNQYDFLVSRMEENGYGPSTSVNNSTLHVSIPIYSSHEALFLSSYRDGNWVYFEKDVRSDTSPVKLDFNSDFKPMQHALILEYSLPGSRGSIDGFKIIKTSPTKVLHHYQSRKSGLPTESNPYKLGYNDGYDYYYTSVTAYFENGVYQQYEKLGSTTPATIPVLNYTLNLKNRDIFNFQFTLSGPFVSRRSLWTLNEAGHNVTWSISSSPDGKQNLQKVYEDLRKRYPELSLAKMVYSNSSFGYYNSNGPIDYKLMYNPPPNFAPNYEQSNITFNELP
ncbi:hypothetical protein BH09BAC3_BH09BAC3_11050 [soil metagenome]